MTTHFDLLFAAGAATKDVMRSADTGPTWGLEDELGWSRLVANAAAEITLGPPGRYLTPTAFLDHYCLPLLEGNAARLETWRLLQTEAWMQPEDELAIAVRRHRERVLAWATAAVDDFQRLGVVTRRESAEAIAVACLIAVESLAELARSTSEFPLATYAVVRDELLIRFAPTRSVH